MKSELDSAIGTLRSFSKQLDQIEDDFHKTTKPIRARIRELNLKVAELKFGVKIGTIVSSKTYKRGLQGTVNVFHRVTKVDIKDWSTGESRPWLEGNPMRKDGTYGTAIRNLYDNWEVDDIKFL